MPKRAITRTSVFVDASLKRALDAINAPRLRTTMPNCICGACDWTPCVARVVSDKDYYTCESCSRRRSASKVLASVTSAVTGDGTADLMIREYLAYERMAVRQRKLKQHVPENRVMIGLYMPAELHGEAKALADKLGITLSCLLASVIAAKVQPQRERAA